MRDANLQRFLHCLASATESAAGRVDDAAARLSRRMFGLCEMANRSFRRGSVSVVGLLSRGALRLLGKPLARPASPVRQGVAARFNRSLQRLLPFGRADCFVRVERAVTGEV
jgi:hypothetical protein